MTAAIHRALVLAVCAVVPTAARTAPTRPRAEAQKVEIRTPDRLQIAGWYYEPTKNRAPGAILVHDAGADHTELQAVAERLWKQGFGVLALDIRGHGDSRSSKADWKSLDENGRRTLWAQGMRDVRAAAEWLLGQKAIHSTKLSLLGYGSGCALVTRYAKEDENVVSLVLLAPRPEDLGFDVRGDIESLIGLPTYVVAPRDHSAATMVEEANELAGPHPYIELLLATPKAPTVLDDRKVPSKVARWMNEIVRPKRGGRS